MSPHDAQKWCEPLHILSIIVLTMSLLGPAAPRGYGYGSPYYSPGPGHYRCGVSTLPPRSSLIVGGAPAMHGAWPWIALLAAWYNNDGTVAWICGGTLITLRHVLTAAHCPLEAIYLVRLGELNFEDTVYDGARPVDFLITDSPIIHPKYVPPESLENGTALYDIALIRLPRTVIVNDFIRPICLPTPEMASNTFENSFAYMAGWGITGRTPGAPMHSALLQVKAQVVSNEACAAKHPNVIESILCTRSPRGGTGACRGDSGGPVVTPINGIYYLIGVISTSTDNCSYADGYHGKNVRVTSFLQWISEVAH